MHCFIQLKSVHENEKVPSPGIFFLVLLPATMTAQKVASRPAAIPYTVKVDKNISDSALVNLVQKQTLRYFWDFAHPVSGLARERSNISFNYGPEVTTTGERVLALWLS